MWLLTTWIESNCPRKGVRNHVPFTIIKFVKLFKVWEGIKLISILDLLLIFELIIKLKVIIEQTKGLLARSFAEQIRFEFFICFCLTVILIFLRRLHVLPSPIKIYPSYNRPAYSTINWSCQSIQLEYSPDEQTKNHS